MSKKSQKTRECLPQVSINPLDFDPFLFLLFSISYSLLFSFSLIVIIFSLSFRVTEKARDLLIEQTIIYFAMQVSFQCMEEKAAEEEEKLRELKEAELREAELARIAEEERSLTAQVSFFFFYYLLSLILGSL